MAHVQQFGSIDDLLDKLGTVDLGAVSALMRSHAPELISHNKNKWIDTLDGIASQIPVGSTRQIPQTTYDEAMLALYGDLDLRDWSRSVTCEQHSHRL